MILRDGTNTSLWQITTNQFVPQSKPFPTSEVDVVVVGGGITGITTALLLQEAGKRCVVAEAAALCFGTTGGTTAHLNTLLDVPYPVIEKKFSKDKASLVATATVRAIELIKHNIDRFNIECGFALQDGYLFAQDEKQDKELETILKSLQDVGLAASKTTTIPIPATFTSAIKVEGQAKFHPTKYVMALATAFEQAGGLILENCRVTDVDDTDPLTITTSRGTLRAKDIVYATHIPPGINLIHLRCAPYRSYAMAVTLLDEKYPDGLVYDMLDPYNYYRTQEINGQKYLIVGGKDHKTGHETNTEKHFMELEILVREQFNVEAIHSKWSSQYFEPADGLPYIGHLPGNPGHVYVATGYGGNGMTYSAVAAITLCDMIINNNAPFAELFDPNRIKPVASFTNFVRHNADVVKQFAEKLFSGDELPELAGLAPGEARIVKYEDKKLGIYKNEDGVVYAINPSCTHMKCEVKWNGSEKSWDCPCHGARYAPDGKLLTGPADHSLERVELRSLVKQ
jgi:glycine/D-amino acid oxidase-like deaminating enzyme/nitrite reductase/ring-hydroxylating ferredoxin subunit